MKWLRWLLGVEEILRRLDVLEEDREAHRPMVWKDEYEVGHKTVKVAFPTEWPEKVPGGDPSAVYERGPADTPEPTSLSGGTWGYL